MSWGELTLSQRLQQTEQLSEQSDQCVYFNIIQIIQTPLGIDKSDGAPN